MPYTDGQELTNAAGDVARYNAADNKWTVIPKSSQPGAAPKQGQAIPPSPDQTSTPTDIGRGLYHAGSDVMAGTVGAPGDVGNKLTEGYDWATGGHHGQPFAGSSDYKGIIDKGVGSFIGGPIKQPEGALGNATKTVGTYAPATVMGRMFGPPGQSWLKSALNNTVGPAAGAELLGAATNDDPRARFVGAMLGGRSLNPWGGRKAQMADKLEGLSKTYQARENAFRADPTVPQKYKEHYDLSDPTQRNQWLTTTYKNSPSGDPPKGMSWKEVDKENAIAHGIHDSHPIADNALPLAGALTAGVFGHRYGLTPEMVGGAGVGGYLGVRGLGKHLPVPTEETVAALLGNNSGRTMTNSVLFSNDARAEKKDQ